MKSTEMQTLGAAYLQLCQCACTEIGHVSRRSCVHTRVLSGAKPSGVDCLVTIVILWTASECWRSQSDCSICLSLL